jgi:hypothetical protein
LILKIIKKTLFWCISERKVLWKVTATTLSNTWFNEKVFCIGGGHG